MGVPVVGVHMVTKERVRFSSMKEAAYAVGAKPPSISYAVNTGCHSIKGYYWFKEGELEDEV